MAARISFVTLFTVVHATATFLLILANFVLSETRAAPLLDCVVQLMSCFMPLFAPAKDGDYRNNDNLVPLLVLNGFLWSLPMLLIFEVLLRRAMRFFSRHEAIRKTDISVAGRDRPVVAADEASKAFGESRTTHDPEHAQSRPETPPSEAGTGGNTDLRGATLDYRRAPQKSGGQVAILLAGQVCSSVAAALFAFLVMAELMDRFGGLQFGVAGYSFDQTLARVCSLEVFFGVAGVSLWAIGRYSYGRTACSWWAGILGAVVTVAGSIMRSINGW